MKTFIGATVTITRKVALEFNQETVSEEEFKSELMKHLSDEDENSVSISQLEFLGDSEDDVDPMFEVLEQ